MWMLFAPMLQAQNFAETNSAQGDQSRVKQKAKQSVREHSDTKVSKGMEEKEYKACSKKFSERERKALS